MEKDSKFVERDFNLVDFARVLYKQRVVFWTVLLLVFLGTLTVKFVIASSKYYATNTFEIGLVDNNVYIKAPQIVADEINKKDYSRSYKSALGLNAPVSVVAQATGGNGSFVVVTISGENNNDVIMASDAFNASFLADQQDLFSVKQDPIIAKKTALQNKITALDAQIKAFDDQIAILSQSSTPSTSANTQLLLTEARINSTDKSAQVSETQSLIADVDRALSNFRPTINISTQTGVIASGKSIVIFGVVALVIGLILGIIFAFIIDFWVENKKFIKE